MLNLNYKGKEACILKEKINLLKKKIFLKPLEADITDIIKFIYLIKLFFKQNI